MLISLPGTSAGTLWRIICYGFASEIVVYRTQRSKIIFYGQEDIINKCDFFVI